MESIINLIVNIFMVCGLIFWIEDAGAHYIRSLKYNYEYEFDPVNFPFVILVSTYWILTFLQAFSADIR